MSSSATTSTKWTNCEKELLFAALQSHGPDDLSLLQAAVPSKSTSSIEKLLLHYRVLAGQTVCDDKLTNFDFISRKPKSASVRSGETLSKWVNALKKCNSAESTSTVLSDSLHAIALLEDHPKPNENFRIDLKRLYTYLACIASGETPPELNLESQEFLVHSLLILASKAKAQRLPEYGDFFHDLTRIFPEHRHLHVDDKSNDAVSRAFHNIVCSNLYNPLELPSHFLSRKPGSDE